MVAAVVVSLLSGLSIVIARIANARLAQQAGIGFSTLMNYVTGLAGAFILFTVGGFYTATAFPSSSLPFIYYIGGAMGVVSVIIFNNVTPRLPSVQLSLLVFVGQIFMGILLDAFLTDTFSPGQLVGAVLVTFGLILNQKGDAKGSQP